MTEKPKANTIWCYKCKAYTVWKPARGKRERCEGCGDVYPCYHDCTHKDCAQDRKAWKL